MISLNAVPLYPKKKRRAFFSGLIGWSKKKTPERPRLPSSPYWRLLGFLDYIIYIPPAPFIVPFRKLRCSVKMVTFHQAAKTAWKTSAANQMTGSTTPPPWGPSQQMYQAIADPDKNPLKTPCKGSLLAQFKRLWNQPSFLLWLMGILKNSFEIKKGGMHDTSFTLCWSFRKENGQFFCSFACHQTPAKNNFACQWNGWGSTPTAILCVTGRHPTWGRQRCLRKWRSRRVASERNHPATIHNSSWICLGAAKYISIKNAFLKKILLHWFSPFQFSSNHFSPCRSYRNLSELIILLEY